MGVFVFRETALGEEVGLSGVKVFCYGVKVGGVGRGGVGNKMNELKGDLFSFSLHQQINQGIIPPIGFKR